MSLHFKFSLRHSSENNKNKKTKTFGWRSRYSSHSKWYPCNIFQQCLCLYFFIVEKNLFQHHLKKEDDCFKLKKKPVRHMILSIQICFKKLMGHTILLVYHFQISISLYFWMDLLYWSSLLDCHCFIRVVQHQSSSVFTGLFFVNLCWFCYKSTGNMNFTWILKKKIGKIFGFFNSFKRKILNHWTHMEIHTKSKLLLIYVWRMGDHVNTYSTQKYWLTIEGFSEKFSQTFLSNSVNVNNYFNRVKIENLLLCRSMIQWSTGGICIVYLPMWRYSRNVLNLNFLFDEFLPYLNE